MLLLFNSGEESSESLSMKYLLSLAFTGNLFFFMYLTVLFSVSSNLDFSFFLFPFSFASSS